MKLFFLIIALSFLFYTCSRKSANTKAEKAHNAGVSAAEAKPLLALSILPQAWFAQRLAGDRVQTLVLVGPSQNPHSYEPTPMQMKQLAQAGAWVLSGTEFEISLTPKVRNIFTSLVIIDGTEGISFRMLDENEDPHDPDELGIDRHTWLGCAPAKIIASHIRDALVLLDPAGKELYDANYTELAGEMDNEFAALRIDLAPLKGSSIYVYHPSFGYFLDEFGMHQKAVETGGKEPGPRELASLITDMKREHIPAIIVQIQFPVNAAKTIAQATGAQLITLDPLSADWLDNIRIMGNALKTATVRDQ